MSCNNKKKFNCGNVKQYASCTYFEGTLPEWSLLDECVDIEETTQELYDKTTEILNSIDVSDLTSDCENFEIRESPTLKELLTDFKTAIEELKCTEGTVVGDIDISGYGLDFSCIKDSCDAEITTLSQLLQGLIDKECNEQEPQVLINTGAIDIETLITHFQTTTTAAATLAAGTEGLEKFILMTQYGGVMVLGVPTLNGGTTLTFNAVGDFVKLLYSGGKWNIISNNSVTVS